MVMDEEDEDV